MKILIVNDFILEGGAEIYVLNLIKLLTEKGNDVSLITFDKDFDNKIEKIDIDKNKVYNFIVNNKLGKLLFIKDLYLKLKKKINEINPDRIIVNNLFSSPITQYKALEGYDVYQVVHDYHFLCPKSTLIKENYEICTGISNEKCIRNCKYHNSKLNLCVKYSLTKKLENIRKKYIKKFIAPSECLTNYLCKNGYDSICINNPINMDNLKNNFNVKKIGKTKKIIYVGMINERKGIFKFLEVFKEYKNRDNIQIQIIGKFTSDDDKDKLDKLLDNNIEYLGSKSNLEVIEILKNSEFMLVPSLWMENYPTTVLEGMLTGNLILGSNRGGIPNMISENKGIQFDILNKNSIFIMLDKICKISQEEYNQIVKKAYEHTIKNNSYENYYKKIIEIINIKKDRKEI